MEDWREESLRNKQTRLNMRDKKEKEVLNWREELKQRRENPNKEEWECIGRTIKKGYKNKTDRYIIRNSKGLDMRIKAEILLIKMEEEGMAVKNLEIVEGKRGKRLRENKEVIEGIMEQ